MTIRSRPFGLTFQSELGGGKFVVETLPTAQVNGTNQVLSKYYLLSTVSKRQE